MKSPDFDCSITANVTTKEAFEAINNVREWWTEVLEGGTHTLNDEFEVRFGDVHYSKQKLIEVIPNKKVVWLVTDSHLGFVKDKNEWTGTQISFEISEQNTGTQIRFTHHGLITQIECYSDCSNAWAGYINNSLLSLLTTGKGQPTQKEI
jgi:hypothetical protein